MNNDNVPFLRQTLRYLGFGEGIASSDQLEIEMQKGIAEFQLKTAACFDEWSTLQATLYFRKSDNLDTYVFTKYDAMLTYDASSQYSRMQTFYIKKGNGVTFKEAFNLLQGRAVYKQLMDVDDETYDAWIELDFTQRTPDNRNYKTHQFGAHYGYDLEKILASYPIQELAMESLKANLLLSLRKGNLHPVTFAKANKMETMYIAASPRYKTISICTEATRLYHMNHMTKNKNALL